jgi:putative FmdB family regulatory protein
VLQREFRRFLKLPLYEYECPKCGTFELVRKFSDAPLESCPTCARPVEKLASAPAIQFKGSGWYITDYARKSTGGEAAGKKEGSDKGSSDKGSSDKGGSEKGGSDKGGSKDSSSSSASESKSSTSEAKSSSSGSSDKK